MDRPRIDRWVPRFWYGVAIFLLIVGAHTGKQTGEFLYTVTGVAGFAFASSFANYWHVNNVRKEAHWAREPLVWGMDAAEQQMEGYGRVIARLIEEADLDEQTRSDLVEQLIDAKRADHTHDEPGPCPACKAAEAKAIDAEGEETDA